MLDWLFGTPKTDKDLLRQYKHDVEHAQWNVNYQIKMYENKEYELLRTLKNKTSKGQLESIRFQAKEVVKYKQAQITLYRLKDNLTTLLLTLEQAKTVNSVMGSLGNVAKMLYTLNQSMKIPSVQQVIAQFHKNSDQFQMKGEIISSGIEGTEGDNELDEDLLLNQVFDQIGYEEERKIQPRNGKIEKDEPETLEKRLEKLKK